MYRKESPAAARTEDVEHVDGGVLAGDVQHGDVEVDTDLRF